MKAKTQHLEDSTDFSMTLSKKYTIGLISFFIIVALLIGAYLLFQSDTSKLITISDDSAKRNAFAYNPSTTEFEKLTEDSWQNGSVMWVEVFDSEIGISCGFEEREALNSFMCLAGYGEDDYKKLQPLKQHNATMTIKITPDMLEKKPVIYIGTNEVRSLIIIESLKPEFNSMTFRTRLLSETEVNELRKIESSFEQVAYTKHIKSTQDNLDTMRKILLDALNK